MPTGIEEAMAMIDGLLTGSGSFAQAVEGWSIISVEMCAAEAGGLAYEARWGSAFFSSSGGAGAVGSAALPLLWMINVWKSLGIGYEEAREIVKNENTQLGFSKGLVTAFLGWKWNQVWEVLGRKNVIRINAFDGRTDVIRVEAYNQGLKVGYLFGAAMPANNSKTILKILRERSGVHAPANWNRSTQDDYVRTLAVKARTLFIR